MAVDFVIFGLMLAVGAILSLVGLLGNRKYGLIGLVGGFFILMLAAVLGQDPAIIMGYYSDGTPLTQDLNHIFIVLLGLLGSVFIILSGLKAHGDL